MRVFSYEKTYRGGTEAFENILLHQTHSGKPAMGGLTLYTSTNRDRSCETMQADSIGFVQAIMFYGRRC